ncbi:MAG TPA: hypothetical protein DDW27_12990 [Bacteroidales bacterium]|nr:hypothetical protein [Bacteroidales bacterium]
MAVGSWQKAHRSQAFAEATACKAAHRSSLTAHLSPLTAHRSMLCFASRSCGEGWSSSLLATKLLF